MKFLCHKKVSLKFSCAHFSKHCKNMHVEKCLITNQSIPADFRVNFQKFRGHKIAKLYCLKSLISINFHLCIIFYNSRSFLNNLKKSTFVLPFSEWKSVGRPCANLCN